MAEDSAAEVAQIYDAKFWWRAPPDGLFYRLDAFINDQLEVLSPLGRATRNEVWRYEFMAAFDVGWSDIEWQRPRSEAERDGDRPRARR